MSKQEIIQFEYDNMRRSRNEGRLKGQYSEMNNQELWDYVCKKWESMLKGEAV